jgi:hypothetical protein
MVGFMEAKEIVEFILNNDDLMENVNEVVKIERRKYFGGWSTEEDIDKFAPIGFSKATREAMRMMSEINDFDYEKMKAANMILLDMYKNDIMKKDDKYLKSAKEQYRSLLIRLSSECDDERWLRCAVVFMAGLNDKELSECDGIYRLIDKQRSTMEST